MNKSNNFIFVYKSVRLDNGDQVFLQLGGNMEKVSSLVVDVEDPLTLNEKADAGTTPISRTQKSR